MAQQPHVQIGRTQNGLTTITATFLGGAASFVLDPDILTEQEFLEQMQHLIQIIQEERKQSR